MTGTRRKRAFLPSGGLGFTLGAMFAIASLVAFSSSPPCAGSCVNPTNFWAAEAGVWGVGGALTGAVLLFAGALMPVRVRRVMTSGIAVLMRRRERRRRAVTDGSARRGRAFES